MNLIPMNRAIYDWTGKCSERQELLYALLQEVKDLGPLIGDSAGKHFQFALRSSDRNVAFYNLEKTVILLHSNFHAISFRVHLELFMRELVGRGFISTYDFNNLKKLPNQNNKWIS